MRSLPVLGLILTGLVASGLVELFSPLVRFALVFLLFSFVTGEVIRTRLIPGVAPGATVASFLLGLSTHAILVWICSLAGLSIAGYAGVVQAFSGLLFVAFILRDRKVAPVRGRPARSPVAILVAAATIGAAFAVFPPVTSPEGDGYDHIGYVRTIMVEGDLSPAGVLAPTALDKPGVTRDDPRKGAFHPLLAVMCRLGDVDPAAAWRWLPMLLAPVAVLAFWRFSRMILPGAAYAAGSMMLFLMFQGGLARDFLSTIAYGQHLSLVFYWALLVAAVAYVRVPARAALATVVVLLLGGALIHLDVLVHFGLAVVTLLLFRKTFGVVRGGLWRLAVASLACACAVVWWKVVTSYGPGNFMHLHPQGLLYFTDSLYVPSPIELLKKYGLLFLAGLTLLPGLLLVRRHRREAWMCLGLALPAVAVAANPWVTPLLYERLGYLVHRFLLNVPVFAVTVLVLGSLIARARAGGIRVRLAAVVVLLAWGKLFTMSANVWARDMGSVNAPVGGPSEARKSLAAWMNRELPVGAVVVSDPATEYWVSAFTRAKVVTVLHQHGTPHDRRVFERLEDASNVMSPFTTQIEALAVIRKYAVEYVLVNGADGASHGYLAEWHPRVADAVREKFTALPSVFDPVYTRDGFVLYRVNGERPEDFTWFPTVPFMRPAPPGSARCGATDDAGPRVTFLHVEPAVALPGETVRVTVGYRRDREFDAPMPLLLHLRFEDRVYFEEARSFPGDKWLRRFRERRDGVFRRFRLDRRPFGGLYLPWMWPFGLDVFETIEYRLPEAVDETTYQIQVNLTDEALIPNFSLRDLLYNDDHYAGVACGEITIRRQVSR